MHNKWDTVILTVGSGQQKALAEKLIDRLDIPHRIIVLSDDESGCRIGSGGALINAVSRCYSDGDRMLIINSGGISKRCINYSVKGKAFAALIYGGREMTLLELIIEKTGAFLDRLPPGVLCCCSDIIAETDASGIDFGDNVGFCNRAGIETGTRHGVMFPDENGKLDIYLHKVKREKLDAASGGGDVLVDTGVTFFTGPFVLKLKETEEKYSLVRIARENRVDINLYPEIIALLGRRVEREEYFGRDLQNEAHAGIRRVLFENLKEFGLNVAEIKNEDFIHFGTVAESVENIRRYAGGAERININSQAENCSFSGRAIIAGSTLKDCTLGRNVYISDIDLESAVIPDDTLVCGIKTQGGYVAVMLPLGENPKDISGGAELWDMPRFYESASFGESLEKILLCPGGERLSLSEIIRRADYDYPALRSK